MTAVSIKILFKNTGVLYCKGQIFFMLQTAEDIRLLNDKIAHAAGFVTRLNDELSKVIVVQHGRIERLLNVLLINCLVLLDFVTGLSITLSI